MLLGATAFGQFTFGQFPSAVVGEVVEVNPHFLGRFSPVTHHRVRYELTQPASWPFSALFPTIALPEDSAYYEAQNSDAPAFDALANDEPGIW